MTTTILLTLNSTLLLSLPNFHRRLPARLISLQLLVCLSSSFILDVASIINKILDELRYLTRNMSNSYTCCSSPKLYFPSNCKRVFKQNLVLFQRKEFDTNGLTQTIRVRYPSTMPLPQNVRLPWVGSPHDILLEYTPKILIVC